MTEYLAIADDDDNVLGKATYDERKAKSLTSRAANVLVFNSKGELFMHKRSLSLDLYPGMWDVKFGGFVRYGESYEAAALRELNEEAAITGAALIEVFRMKSRRPENRTNRKVFKCTYNGKITLDPAEVAEGKFVTVKEAERMMKKGKLSPSAQDIFREWLGRDGR